MVIQQLTARDFRNFEALKIEPSPGLNIIWGDNAQGKTNLLEAMWLFTGTRSFRGVKDAQLVRTGCECAELSLAFSAHGRDQTAKLTIDDRRHATLNGVPKKSASALISRFTVVAFSPAHLMLVRGAPNDRRRFLQTLLCQTAPQYAPLVVGYQKVLLQRNALLKNLSYKGGGSELLDVYDESLVNYGAKLHMEQLRLCRMLGEHAARLYGDIAHGREQLTLRYESGLPTGEGLGEAEIRAAFLEALRSRRQGDLRLQATGFGPHRDDLGLYLDGEALKIYGSQGQQRSAVIALKEAECAVLEQATGERPVLLLDDVLSELDRERQKFILSGAHDAQVFITCCDRERFALKGAGKAFRIEAGQLTQTLYRKKAKKPQEE